MPGFNQCIQDIIRAAGGRLTKREAAELLRRFNDTARRLNAAERIEALDVLLARARNNMVKRDEILVLQAKRNAITFKLKVDASVEKALNIARADKRGKASLVASSDERFSIRHALTVLLFGSPEHREGLVQLWQGAVERFKIALVGQLEEADLVGHWKDKATLESAIDAAWDPSAKVISPEAQAIGNILGRIQKLAVRRLNSVGSYVLDTPRVLFNSKVAEPYKVRQMGRSEFIDFVKNLDLDRSYFDGMEDADIDKYFGNLYDQLVRGDHFRAPTGTYDGINGLVKSRFRDLAANFSIDHDVPFASAAAYKKFVAAFSDEPLQAILTRRIDQIGRAVGLMEAFGPVPERFFKELFSKLEPHMTEEDRVFLLNHRLLDKAMSVDLKPIDLNKPGQLVKGALQLPLKIINRLYHDVHPLDALMYMDGSTSAPVSGTWARLGAGVRSWASMASLGWGMFMQFTDLPIRVAQLVKLGKDPFDAVLSPITAFGTALPDKERKLFYTRLGVAADLMSTNLAFQADTVGYQPRMISRMMDAYFKANGMYGMDIVGKRFTADFMSSNLAWALRNPSEGTNMLNLFRSFGFTQEDFNQLLMAVREMNGIEVVDPHLLQGKSDKLYEKYLGVMDDVIRSVTPTPGVRERATVQKGFRPGDPIGEILSMAMMFKSYPIMFMTRIMPQLHYEHGTLGTLTTMVSMMAFWYIGDSLKQLAQGKTPRRLDKPSTVLMAMTRSGFGGLYSDLISADYHRHGMEFTTMIGGPVAGKLNDLASVASAARSGDLSTGMAASKLSRALPNIHLFQTLLDRAILYGVLEKADPGVVERTDKRLRENTGQERIF